LHFQELGASLKKRMGNDLLLGDFASSIYVPNIVDHTGAPRKVSWVGFAHRRFGDPRTSVEFQYGTARGGPSFFGIWIQGDYATRPARVRAHDSLRRYTAADLAKRFAALGSDVSLHCWSNKTKRHPRFELDQYVTDLTEDDIEDFTVGLRNRLLWVHLGSWPSKSWLLRLRNVEGEIVKMTKRLLPAYRLLAGFDGGPKAFATRSASRFNRVGVARLAQEERELQKAAVPTRTEALSQAKRRIGQELVRQGASVNYPEGCAMCARPRIALEGLLVASHVKKWANSTRTERFDNANVLRLCALHDELFERGYLTVGDDLKVSYSSKISDEATLRFLKSYTRSELSGWKERPPGVKYLSWHRGRHSDMGPFNPIS